jgi:hypothetical protein
MARAVYAVFDSQGDAHAAVHALLRNGLPEDVHGVQLHTEMVDVEDLPVAATMSREWAWLAAAVLALIGALVGTLGDDPSGMLFGAVSGALVGTLVAASSGRRTPKPEIGRLRADVEGGRTVVTMDVSRAGVGLACERFMECRGAIRVGMT